MAEIVRLADEEGASASEIAKVIPTHFREVMGDRFFKAALAPTAWTGFRIVAHYWRERQYRALPRFDPNTIKVSIFNPPKNRLRDVGQYEPANPNPYPFLDGQPIPTVAELKHVGHVG